MRARSEGRLAGTLVSRVLVPASACALVVARRRWRLQDGPDTSIYLGIVRNLRSGLSLTSATDQFWIRLSPAETLRHLGHIPVPDFGPTYPALAAAVPLGVGPALLAVNVAALFIAVFSIGEIAHRITASRLAAVATQSIALWGPLAVDIFFVDGRPLDLFAAVGPDPLATALLLAAIALLVCRDPVEPADDVGQATTTRWRRHRRDIAIIALVAAATTSRYAYIGAALGLAVGLAPRPWQRRPAATRRWRLPLIGVAITLLWQFVLYPLLVAGGGPKAFAYHRASVSALGVTMIGWTGLHVRTPFVANLVVVAVIIACTGTFVMARTGGVASIAAAVIVGQLAVLIASMQFLDVSINLREERHVIIVRFMIVVLIIVAISRLGARRRSRVPQRLERWRVAAPVVLVALVAALAANGWPWPSRGLLSREDFSDGRAILDRYSNLPVVSNQTESWYMMTGTPAADLPRTAEMTSGQPRDDVAEVAAMARAVPDGHVLQAYRKGFWETMNLRDYPCVVVIEDEPLLRSLFQLSILDISGCR